MRYFLECLSIILAVVFCSYFVLIAVLTIWQFPIYFVYIQILTTIGLVLFIILALLSIFKKPKP